MRFMTSRRIAAIAGLAFSLTAFTIPLFSPASAQAANESAARELVLEAWTTSRAPELYADLRHSIHAVMIPATDDLVTGKVKMPLASNPRFSAIYTEVNALVKNLDKAGDEFDTVSAKYKQEYIDDLSRVIAKHLTAEEIEGARGVLRLSATKKGFDAIYKIYGILTNQTYEDVHANQLLDAFVQELIIRYAATQGKPQAVTQPTPDRIAKATAISNEFMTSAHVDEMITDGIRFAKEVVVAVAPEAERAKLKTQIDTFEQQYAVQKPLFMILIPTGLATYLGEAELDQLQKHMRGPGIAQFYKSLFTAERAVTSFTVADLETAKTHLEGLKARGLFRERTADEKAAIDMDMAALKIKWEPRLADAISPATREAIEKSVKELEKLAKEPWLSVPSLQ